MKNYFSMHRFIVGARVGKQKCNEANIFFTLFYFYQQTATCHFSIFAEKLKKKIPAFFDSLIIYTYQTLIQRPFLIFLFVTSHKNVNVNLTSNALINLGIHLVSSCLKIKDQSQKKIITWKYNLCFHLLRFKNEYEFFSQTSRKHFFSFQLIC